MTSTFPAVTKRKPALASLLLQKCKFNIFKVKQEKKKRQQNTDAKFVAVWVASFTCMH